MTPKKVRAIGLELNKWLYGAGGLCAFAYTRGTLFVLRDSCLHWDGTKAALNKIHRVRRAALFALRRDIGLNVLEEIDLDERTKYVEIVQNDMEAAQSTLPQPRGIRQRLSWRMAGRL